MILKNMPEFPREEIPLTEAFGRVLREDITADRDYPPIHRALLDGIAVKLAAYKKGVRKFAIEGIQPAGQEALSLKSDEGCFEIMTGAALPAGCDCLIPVEHTRIEDHEAFAANGLEPEVMQNIRPQAADYEEGARLLKAGRILKMPQAAVCASVGKTRVKVTCKPRVAVISTGDELVEIERKPKPYQVRKSNSLALQAAFQLTHLFETSIFHIRDDKNLLRKDIGSILKKFDVLVLSGGVSMGKFDFVPEVLRELGVEVLFHKVRQKPGKPFWFGKSRDGKPVFALPGNPVSTQIMTRRYVMPALKKALGAAAIPQEWAALAEDFHPQTSLTYFCPVVLKNSLQGPPEAQPVAMSGSGDFAALAGSDGFVEIPEAAECVFRGQSFLFYKW